MENEQIREFRKILRRFERITSNQLKDTGCCGGLSQAQCHILLEIQERGTTTIVDLAREVKLDKSTLSRTVDSLVNGGYVERTPLPSDRRYFQISASEKGKEKASSINLDADDFYYKVFDNIPEWKHKDIIESLTLLTLAFSAEEKKKNEDEYENTDESCCG